MLKSDSNTRVLSSPHILISNNEEGLFSSGKKIFYQSSTVNENTGITAPTVEKEEVKLQLKIKPNISYSDYVTMTIELDSDSLAGTDPKSGFPVISKRKTTQTVTVKNGQTIVISGLVETTESETYRKIPLLGDLPVLGWLLETVLLVKLRTILLSLLPHTLCTVHKTWLRSIKRKSLRGTNFSRHGDQTLRMTSFMQLYLLTKTVNSIQPRLT